MSPNQSLVVVVRLFALWLIGYYMTTAPWFYVQAKKFSPDSAVAYSLGAAAIVLALSAALWFAASWIAKRLISGPSQAAEQPAAFDSWFSVGCALIGLWVLAKAIPALLHYFIANFMGAGMFPNTYMVTPEWHLTAIFNTIQLLFGLALFLGGKGINKAVLWVRNAY
jgi:flagellar biosynthesis protein FlhB